MIRKLIVFCILLAPFIGAAQDKILLMNGLEVDCKITADTGYVVAFDVTKRSGKVKHKVANRGEIFSYTLEGENEVIVYELDTIFGNNEYTASQMRAYLAGEHDARVNFKARHIMIIGFVTCGTIAYLGQDGYFTAVGPPVVYTLTQLIGKVKIRESTMSNVGYKYNDLYADGYEPPARTKKIVRAFLSGFAGSALGVSLFFITK
ncbi:MAG: hypothetical protein R2809_03235 [Flavobacteriales bacterium]